MPESSAHLTGPMSILSSSSFNPNISLSSSHTSTEESSSSLSPATKESNGEMGISHCSVVIQHDLQSIFVNDPYGQYYNHTISKKLSELLFHPKASCHLNEQNEQQLFLNLAHEKALGGGYVSCTSVQHILAVMEVVKKEAIDKIILHTFFRQSTYYNFEALKAIFDNLPSTLKKLEISSVIVDDFTPEQFELLNNIVGKDITIIIDGDEYHGQFTGNVTGRYLEEVDEDTVELGDTPHQGDIPPHQENNAYSLDSSVVECTGEVFEAVE